MLLSKPWETPTAAGTVVNLSPVLSVLNQWDCCSLGPLRARYICADWSDISQCHEPLCSIWKKSEVPVSVFSIYPIGRYSLVDQLPVLVKFAAFEERCSLVF